MSKCIKLENVSKSYGDAKVLNDISVTFDAGLIHGLIGRNGSGKTLLLKAMLGLIKVGGNIEMNGKRVHGNTYCDPDVGAIIENPSFLSHESGFKNLWSLAAINRRVSKDEVRHALDLVGLKNVGDEKVKKYSLGTKQRLAIAQSFMEKQTTLLLDEPLNGLDKQGLSDIRELFLILKEEGRTFVIASHSAEDINVLCDHVYEMDRGYLRQVS